tara:strand:+ start:385 stop:591 length:207 start_codon:yes stop_codon:yes gene_type:complete
MSEYKRRVLSKNKYNEDLHGTNISRMTNHLERKHDINRSLVQVRYRWEPHRDTLGDIIREYENKIMDM